MRPQPTPDVKSHSSFGTVMSERTWSAGSGYRYGFNGKEGDDEFSVDKGSYDFGARMYDSRLGRWWKVDPFNAKHPGLSPLIFCSNNPNRYIDPDGKRFLIAVGMNDDYTKLALEDVKGVIGNAKYNDLIVHNIETGEITFDLSKVPLEERNGGMLLFADVCNSDKKYLYEISTKAVGVNRDDGTPTSAQLTRSEQDYVSKVATNMSNTARGADDKADYLSKENSSQERYDAYDALPKDGFDGQVVLSPFIVGRYDQYDVTKDEFGKDQYTNLVAEKRASLFFHELAENYHRTNGNSGYKDAHKEAIEDEKSLPAGHPAKGANPGRSYTIKK